MSKQVDERVVSMQFDNKHFEKNVSTTMSTLDKLKQALHFKGASKGIDETTTGMSGIGTAVQAVSTKFSAMQVMAVTALANITNSAVNAGKQIVKSLTIDPVKDGFQEYEMTLNAVQTTMAATGKTSKEVEKELKKLDEYADKTVYGTADMLNNLPKFTNAGVELEKATTAMIGIANATALAGGDASKASIAFYNLGQAIGTGYLTRMDYNSINNAGIATMEWKNQMVEAAIAQGTLTKVGEDAYQAGNKTLTLQQLFIDGLQEQWATTEVMMKVFGDYGDETTEIGKKAYSAAQDIKTYTQMMESLKATAGTGWKDTWQIIIGGLEGAKEFWTGLNDLISGFITKTADWRNAILESALGTKFADLSKMLSTPAKAAEKAVTSLEYYQDIVNRVWRGDFKNQPYRYDLLDDAGYNHAVVQSLVDKGYQYQLTIEDVNEAIAKWGNHGKNIVKINGDVAESQDKVNDIQQKTIEQLLEMSDAELLAAGYAQEQIDALREVSKWAKAAGVSIADFLKEPEKYAGRTMLIDSLKEFGKVLGDIATVAKTAWQEIFPPKSTEEWAFMIYGWIGALKQFTSSIKDLLIKDGELTDTGKKLARSFKGLFAIIDIIWKILGGGFRIALEAVKTILGLFGLDILDVTAALGDAIVSFHDFLEATLSVKAVIEWMAPAIRKVVDFFKKLGGAVKSSFDGFSIRGLIEEFKAWIEYLKTVEDLPKAIADGIIGTFGRALNFVKKIFGSIGSTLAEQFGITPENLIQGFANGIWNGIKTIGQVIWELGAAALAKFREVLGIHSPSTETYSDGENFMLGFWNGLKDFAKMVWDTIMTFGQKCIDILKELDFGKVVAGFVSGGLVVGFVKIASAFKSFADTFSGIQDVFEEAGETLKTFQGTLKSYSTNLKVEAIKSLAISLAILVGCVVALALVPADRLWVAIGALGALIGALGILVGLSVVINKFGAGGTITELATFGAIMLEFSAALMILALVAKMLGSMEENQFKQGLIAIGILSTIIVVLMAATQLAGTYGIGALSGTLMAIAGAMVLMTLVVKILGGLELDQIWLGMKCIAIFGLMIVGLMAATKLVGTNNIRHLGTMLVSMAGAMLLMALVIKILGNMEIAALAKGISVVVLFGSIIVGLMAATKLVGGRIKDLGTVLIGVGIAMGLMALVVRMLGNMETTSLVKGIVAVAAFGGIIVGLMAATKLAGGKQAKELGLTLMMVSVAIAILAATAVLLSLIDVAGLAKGVIAVGILASFMAGLIFVTKFATDCVGTIVAITVAIAVLATAVGVLSFIDPEKLKTPAIILGALMGMMAALMVSTKFASKSGILPLIAIMGVVVILSGILLLLSDLNAQTSIASAAALSILMLAMAGVLAILAAIGSAVGPALLGTIGLLALAIPLLAFVGVLYLMQNVQNATTNVLLLVTMATALTLLIPILVLCGALIYPALLGIAALTLMAVPLLAFIGVLALMEKADLQNAENNIKLLFSMMTPLVAMLLVIAPIAPLATLGVVALTALVGLVTVMFGLATAIGGLLETVPFLQTFLDTGVPVMIQLAGGLGEMIGAFIAGISKQVMTIMPMLGASMSMFMINALPFIAISKSLGWDVAEGAGIMAASILALTTAQAINGIVSFLNGGISFSVLGAELSLFMMNALPFLSIAKNVGAETLEGVKNLAEAILCLTAADILQVFGGGINFDQFGEDCKKLGEGVKKFKEGVGDLTEDDLAQLDIGTQAMAKIAEATKQLPKEGGLWQKLTGENGFTTFVQALADAGPNLKSFVTNTSGFNQDTLNQVDFAAQAISKLGTAAKDIPGENGLWDKFAGGNGNFGEFMKVLGGTSESKGAGALLATFASDLGESGEFGEAQYNRCEWGAKAISAIGQAAQDIPDDKGWLQKFAGGGKDLASFMQTVSESAEHIVTFSDGLSGIKTWRIDSAAELFTSIGNFMSGIAELGINYSTSPEYLFNFGSDLAGLTGKLCDVNSHAESIDNGKLSKLFGVIKGHIIGTINALLEVLDGKGWKKNKLFNFGSDLAGLSGKLCDVNSHGESISQESIDKVVTAVASLVNMAKGVEELDLDSNSITSFTSGLEELALTGIDGLISAFENAPADIAKAIGTMISNALDQTDGNYQKFFDAGEYFAQGFANGIRSNQSNALADAAGAAIGKKALAALNRTIEVASPSKETFRSGGFFTRGFANGIIDNLKGVYDASSETGSEALRGLSDAISKVGRAVMLDIDTQPTIRPVLDLSDVRAGAGMIGNLFDTNPSVGLMANVGAINSMMNRQNGANDDVISAINSLGKKLGDVGGTQYNINGVSINEDEAVVDAVKTIVRAARMERRV